MVGRQAETAAPARRPRDRKAQIVAAASLLFRQHGYRNVSLADVAAAVGITAPALYRHFRNKDELLLWTVKAGFETVEDAVFGAETLDDLYAAMMPLILERHGLSSLWQREARHLPEDQRTALRGRVSTITGHIAVLLTRARPGLTPEDADLLSLAVMSVFASRVGQRTPMPRRELEQTIWQLMDAVAGCELGTAAPGTTDGRQEPAVVPRRSRRELLLSEATRLFDERGYQSVNMSDIGAAAGIAGPSVYKHFAGKSELLVAALVRGREQMLSGMSRALAGAAGVPDALDRLLRAHIEFSLENSHVIGILISERDQLPEPDRKSTYRIQQEYEEVWIGVLRDTRPEIGEERAKVVVNTVFATINNVVRTRLQRTRPDLADRLAEIGIALAQA